MYKTFKLNKWQKIEIPESHKLFNNVLIASIANQDINDILHDCLIEKGYLFNYEYWYPENFSGHIDEINFKL